MLRKYVSKNFKVHILKSSEQVLYNKESEQC